MKKVQKFVTADGKEFLTAVEAQSYEDDKLVRRLAGLKIETLRAVCARQTIEGVDTAAIADAIELLGRRIAAARRAGGELRHAGRGPKTKDGVETNA